MITPIEKEWLEKHSSELESYDFLLAKFLRDTQEALGSSLSAVKLSVLCAEVRGNYSFYFKTISNSDEIYRVVFYIMDPRNHNMLTYLGTSIAFNHEPDSSEIKKALAGHLEIFEINLDNLPNLSRGL